MEDENVKLSSNEQKPEPEEVKKVVDNWNFDLPPKACSVDNPDCESCQ